MTDLESLKEKLALHGYVYRESYLVIDQGETFCFGKEISGRRLILKCFIEDQGHKFWNISLWSFVRLFKDDKYMHPVLHNEILGITEEYLKFLPQLEARLLEIKNEPIP